MNSENNIVRLIEENLFLFDSFMHVYVFGSSLNSKVINNDIDLLVIYSKYSENINRNLKSISKELGMKSGLYIDLTALSEEEEQETGFLAKIQPNYLKLK